jgi:hypothetical protein
MSESTEGVGKYTRTVFYTLEITLEALKLLTTTTAETLRDLFLAYMWPLSSCHSCRAVGLMTITLTVIEL